MADLALPEPRATCPYLGLVAYDVGDAEGFFGRDADVAACLRRLATTDVLAVVGPSGSGKSSLVRAGVAAALGRDGRRVVVITPGAHPNDALTVLPTTGPAPVLVVDQCEEALILCSDSDEQARFFATLVAHAERAPLVVALRTDRLEELSAHAGFVRLIEAGLYLLGAMGEADLRAAIQGPAHQAGLLLEPGLVELLVREVEGEPGALPLLSHALRTTWEHREGRTLTVDGYRDTGGIRGAVAQSAEQLYEQVPPDQQPLVRDLLLRLVAPSPDGEPVPCRLPRRIIATDPAHENLVERLVAARLLTSDDVMVELAHEALARAWPRLRGWLDDDIEGQRVLRHLTGAADTWDAMGRPDSELYRGARLAQALDWRDRAQPDLTPTEQAFLDAGGTLVDAERQAALDRAPPSPHQPTPASPARRDRDLPGRVHRRGLRGRQPARTGQHQSRVATGRELAAAANANLEVDPERSILLALEAVKRTRSTDGSVLPEAEEALHRAVAASRIERRVPGIGGRLDWSPDGTVFVAEGPEGSGIVDIRDAGTGESVRSFRGNGDDVRDVAFNHDGTLLATTGEDGAARIWDPDTGETLHTVESPDAGDLGVSGPSFSPDGSRFAAAWPGDGVVKVLDLGTGRVVQEIRSVPHPGGTSFDPSGARIAVGSDTGPMAAVSDVESGDEVFTLEGHSGVVTDIAWSPDGKSIATASQDRSARIFDARTGAPRFAILGRGGEVYDLDWNPDATRLVTGHGDGAARVWHVTEGGPREEFALTAQDTRNGVSGVAFSPDGTHVITGDFGTTAARVWDVSITGDAEITNLPAVANAYGAVDFTSDGRQLVATSSAGSVTAWDIQSRTRVRTIGATGPPPAPTVGGPPEQSLASGADVFSLDLSPDDRLVAAARLDGTVRVWDLATGRDAFAVDPGPTLPGAPYMDVGWSPDGDLLAIAANDGLTGRVTILDRAGREAIEPLQMEHGIAVGSVAFSPDGERLITTRLPTADPDPDAIQVVIWDWKAREIERTIATEASGTVHSPTGHILATRSWGQGPARAAVSTSGTRPPGRTSRPSPGAPEWWTSPSAPMHRVSPPPATMAPCGSGTHPLATSLPCCTVTTPRSDPSRSAPTARGSRRWAWKGPCVSGRSTWTTSSTSPSVSSPAPSPTRSADSICTCSSAPDPPVTGPFPSVKRSSAAGPVVTKSVERFPRPPCCRQIPASDEG